MSVVEIEGLVKKYGDNIAVDHLNLNVEKGRVYGFLGPNGAGKSTTMNIIIGYIGASDGTVKIGGYDIFKEAEKAKKMCGISTGNATFISGYDSERISAVCNRIETNS